MTALQLVSALDRDSQINFRQHPASGMHSRPRCFLHCYRLDFTSDVCKSGDRCWPNKFTDLAYADDTVLFLPGDQD